MLVPTNTLQRLLQTHPTCLYTVSVLICYRREIYLRNRDGFELKVKNEVQNSDTQHLTIGFTTSDGALAHFLSAFTLAQMPLPSSHKYPLPKVSAIVVTAFFLSRR